MLEEDFSGVKRERSKKANTMSVSFFIERGVKTDSEVLRYVSASRSQLTQKNHHSNCSSEWKEGIPAFY
jgi:hypothetical protein